MLLFGEINRALNYLGRLRFMKGSMAVLIGFLLIVVGCVFWSLSHFLVLAVAVRAGMFLSTMPHAPPPHALPPSYADYYAAELRLAQHNWNRTALESGQKFFFVAGHTTGLGWGYAMQEHFLNAYVAYKSERTFVFGNYTWEDDGSSHSGFKVKNVPKQIPFSALFRGPIVGEPFYSGHQNAPLSVTKAHFDHLCPDKLGVAHGNLSSHLTSLGSTVRTLDRWTTLLKTVEDPCVQSTPETGPIFTQDAFEVHASLLDIWQSISTSPFITHFGWSPLVELAFDTNRDLFLSTPISEPYLTAMPFTTNADRYTVIPGLMVIHVHRGGHHVHCDPPAESPGERSINPFLTTVEKTHAPLDRISRKTSPSVTQRAYREHCDPTINEIVEKVVSIRKTPAAHDIHKLYILTNERPHFIRDLKDALWANAEWDMISSSPDLILNWEQRFLSQAVETLVAQRAQVFIGNAFSMDTSLAVMMRLANAFPMDSTRFW